MHCNHIIKYTTHRISDRSYKSYDQGPRCWHFIIPWLRHVSIFPDHKFHRINWSSWNSIVKYLNSPDNQRSVWLRWTKKWTTLHRNCSWPYEKPTPWSNKFFESYDLTKQSSISFHLTRTGKVFPCVHETKIIPGNTTFHHCWNITIFAWSPAFFQHSTHLHILAALSCHRCGQIAHAMARTDREIARLLNCLSTAGLT